MTDPTLSRRALLATALAAPAARAGDPAITTLQPWERVLGPGVDAQPYGQPAPQEADVIRRTVPWLTPDTAAGVNFTPLHALDGILTPNGLCFARHHSGIAEIEPRDHRLMLHGRVDRPLVFTLEDLKRLPRVTRIAFLECSANTSLEWRGPQNAGVQFTHGMLHCCAWTGVALRDVLALAGVRPAARWLLAEGADAAHLTRSIPLDKALDDCLIAWGQNGEALRPDQGYPLRLVVPGWEGNTWVKWLRRLELGDQPWMTREETSKYTDLMPDGRARQFTWAMDVKSVITAPSPEVPVPGPGPVVISGLAWSGAGGIAGVDVSLNGGRDWAPARIDGPQLPQALHRFYARIDWNGQPMLLQSRATDSGGRTQPTKAALRALRGLNSIYHMNGIQTWALAADGSLQNVDVG